jgi:hypothetical protein
VQNIQVDIAERKCPNCGEFGRIELLISEFRFRCRKCTSKLIDPWAIGPWDEKEILIDTVEGDRVSLYVDKSEPVEEPLEPRQEWLDFLKHLYGDAGKRQYVKRL